MKGWKTAATDGWVGEEEEGGGGEDEKKSLSLEVEKRGEQKKI